MITQDEIAKYYRENIRLVHKVAQAYSKSDYEYDDLFQEASLGLVKGLQTFDETKGVKISTYLYKCMRNEINQRIRKDNAKSRTAVVVSYDAEMVGKDGRLMSGIENMDLSNVDSLHGFTERMETIVEAKDVAETAKKIIANYLTDLEREIFLLHMNGKTQTEIARSMKLSQANISKALKMTRCKMAYYLKEAGYDYLQYI